MPATVVKRMGQAVSIFLFANASRILNKGTSASVAVVYQVGLLTSVAIFGGVYGRISGAAQRMMLLLLGEMTVWFTTTKIKYEFDVDSDYESKMHLNMDITFNSPCHMISADIVDSSGDAWGYSFQLQEDAADFELTKEKAVERAKLLKMKESMTDPNMR